jgi:hypothetical protein
MRTVFAVVVLVLLGACEGMFFASHDRWHTPRIGEAYEARDACLARNAATGSTNEDITVAARAVAQACASETEKLVAVTNREGDAKVASNIREDTRFRAVGYVLKARGQLIF